MIRILLIALITACLVSSPASAQVEVNSANFMMPGCRDFIVLVKKTGAPLSAGAFAAGNCAGRIEGLLGLRDDLTPNIRFCKPASVTTGQAVQMVLTWLEAHPERWHEDFILLAHGVFKRSWPCR